MTCRSSLTTASASRKEFTTPSRTRPHSLGDGPPPPGPRDEGSPLPSTSRNLSFRPAQADKSRTHAMTAHGSRRQAAATALAAPGRAAILTSDPEDLTALCGRPATLIEV
jgi:hypothetical protein